MGAKAYEGIDAGIRNPEDIHEELKGVALGTDYERHIL
jgi:hypothetical protein